MKQLVFSVWDQKAAAHLPPFFLHTVGLAERAFAQAITDETHQFGKNPEDYYLYYIGEWDDASGNFENVEHKLIANGIQLKHSIQEQAKQQENTET